MCAEKRASCGTRWAPFTSARAYSSTAGGSRSRMRVRGDRGSSESSGEKEWMAFITSVPPSPSIAA